MNYAKEPTVAELKEMWMDAISYAGPSEKYDRELAFDMFFARLGVLA